MSQRQSNVERFYRFALGAFLFVLVLALYTGTNDPTIHIKRLLIAWAAGALTGSYVLVAMLMRIPFRRPTIFMELILLLLGFFFVSSLFSEFHTISLLETARFFSLFALYGLATQVYSSPAQVLRLFTIFCCAVSFAAVYAVLQAAGIDPVAWTDTTSDTYTNLPATYGNPNFAAHALILAFIMLACLVLSGARWVVWVAPLLFFHLYSTDQRAGWIAMAGAGVLVALAWLLLRRTRRPVVGVAGTMALFALLGVFVVGGAMYVTHARTGHLFPLDLSLLLRYQSYVSATKMLFDAPVLGHGPAVYGIAYAPYWTPFEQAWFAQEMRMNEHVHNDLLELAIDGGLAAAGLYLAMLVLGMCFALLLAAQGPTPAHRRIGFTLAALFCAFMIDGLFGFNLRVPVTATLFFLLMGVLDGLWSEDRRSEAGLRLGGSGLALRAALIGVLVLCTWQETQRFASDYAFFKGIRAQKASQFEAADAAYRNAERLAPWNWHSARRLGLLHLEQQHVVEALEDLERSLRVNPYYFLTHLPMARANLMLAQAAVSRSGGGGIDEANERLDVARKHAEAVLAAVPDFFAADDILGRIESIAAILERDHAETPDPALQASHWENARLHLGKAIDQGPENAGELYRMLMQVEMGLGNVDGAEQALIGAVQVAPDEARTWPVFLNFARQQHRFERMRDVLYQQIDRLQALEKPGDSDRAQLASAYLWLARVMDEGYGDTQGVMDAYAGATQYGPERPEIWSAYAEYARKEQRMADFGAAVRLASSRVQEQGGVLLPQVASADAVLTDAAGQLDPASRLLLAGLRSYPPESELPVDMAFAWAARIVQEAYETLATAGTAPCESALNLGVVAASLNDLGLSSRLLETAFACLTDERRAAAAVHWADTLVRLDQKEKALTILRETEALFPGHFDTRWALARTLARMQRSSEARTIYEALLNDPNLAPQGKAQLEEEVKQLPTT